jgi:cobalt-zinc-cadmium efflux system outer membrane protein
MRRGPAWLTILFGHLLPSVALASEEGVSPLRFEEVLQSVSAHDPRIRKAIEGLRQAESTTREARGAFDPKLQGDAKLRTGGYYDLRRANVELRQPTTLWGSEIYVGYRIGRGINQTWPTYYEDQTLSDGEIRAGLELPIWRGGLIDEPRARRARAIHLEEAAGHELSATALNLELAAAGAYWKWVSVGQKLGVTRALVQLAEERDGQLRRRLAAGSIAEFDVTDNERILLERRALLVSAQRAFQQAAFELSLFLRDALGRSIVPESNRLPLEQARPQERDPVEELVLQKVLVCHPEVRRVRAELEASEVDVALTKNQLAPELRGRFQYSRDLGELTGTPLDFTLPGNVFEAGIELSMPLPLRSERGRAGVERAKVAQKKAELRFVEDQLSARVRDAASAVLAAQERVDLTEQVVETAAQLAEGERRRFEVGASNLIFVNLREQQAAMARMQLIEAIAIVEIERTRWDTTTQVECGRDG